MTQQTLAIRQAIPGDRMQDGLTIKSVSVLTTRIYTVWLEDGNVMQFGDLEHPERIIPSYGVTVTRDDDKSYEEWIRAHSIK